jgi:hypothetical protein
MPNSRSKLRVVLTFFNLQVINLSPTQGKVVNQLKFMLGSVILEHPAGMSEDLIYITYLQRCSILQQLMRIWADLEGDPVLEIQILLPRSQEKERTTPNSEREYWRLQKVEQNLIIEI